MSKCGWCSSGTVFKLISLSTNPLKLYIYELKRWVVSPTYKQQTRVGQVLYNCCQHSHSKVGKTEGISGHWSITILKSGLISGLSSTLWVFLRGSWFCPLSYLSFSIRNDLCMNLNSLSACFLSLKDWESKKPLFILYCLYSFQSKLHSLKKTSWVFCIKYIICMCVSICNVLH